MSTTVYVQLPPNGAASWREPVSTATALPATASLGDERVAQDTGTNYVWTGSAWQAAGGGGGGGITALTGDVTASGTGSVAATVASVGGKTAAAIATVVTNTSGTNTGDQTITLTGPITGSGTGSFATSIAAQTGTGTTFAMSAGPTFTGAVGYAAGSVSTPSINFGTANTGIFGTSALVETTIAGVLSTSFGAGICKFLGPTGIGLLIDSSITSSNGVIAIYASNTGGNGTIYISNRNSGGMGSDWMTLAGASDGAPPAYPLMFNCASANGAVTDFSQLKPNNSANINNWPTVAMVNRSATVGALCGYTTAGSTLNAQSWAGSVQIVATSGSEQADYKIATAKAGALTDSLRILGASGQTKIMQAGAGLSIKEGSNCKQGTAVLVAGTVTVSNTSITASSRVFLTHNVAGGTLGIPSLGTVVAGTSFVINSSNAADTSTIAYLITEPS